MPDARRWWPQAVLAVALITGARLVALAFNRTDLFVDESQYWLWGQNLDFGYYSKPPLIAWLIRAVTELAGSDAAFWVRAPGAVLHGATALILGALAAQLSGGRAAFWTAISYATLPMVSLGSLLMSTDTVMAPFFAAALFFHVRTVESGLARFALMAGAAAGLAFLAKYAAVYFLLGAALSALAVPAFRTGWRNAALLALAFGVVALPNVVWNIGHDLTTVSHTMDNVGWVRGSWFSTLNPAGLATFFFSQFAVVGPILFAAYLWRVVRPGDTRARALVLFSVPVLAIVCVQAFLAKAYANWAVATYFAGTVLAVPMLLRWGRGWLMASLAVNGAIAVTLPVLAILAPEVRSGGDRPLLARYLGRAALSTEIAATARAAGTDAVLTGHRDILADLYYTAPAPGLAVFAPRPQGAPRNYYEQTYPLPADFAGALLYVGTAAPVCDGTALLPVTTFDTGQGAYHRLALSAYLVPGGCAHDLR